jgi:hypothetical protein
MSEQPQPNLNWYRDLGETYREMAERTAEEPPPEGHEDSARSLSEHYKVKNAQRSKTVKVWSP